MMSGLVDANALYQEFEERSARQRCRARWRMLFYGNPGERQLIASEAERVETGECFPHPLFLPASGVRERMTPLLRELVEREGFVSDEDRIPAVHDEGVADAFLEKGWWKALPRFLLAGARREYRLNPAELKVGILTAGGNAPGLNMVIDSIVKRHFLLGTLCCPEGERTRDNYPPGLRVWGYRGGYVGLLEKRYDQLDPRETDARAAEGGTMLRTLRGAGAPEEVARQLASRILEDDLDVLYAIGGDGTMKVAKEIAKQLRQMEETGACGRRRCLVVCCPKTMDNDILFTDTTFGFRTVVDNAVEIIRTFHTEAETLERVGLIEFFGAKSGFVALHAGYTSGEADYILIPEAMGSQPEQFRLELEMAVERLAQRVEVRRHALLIIAEGATLQAQDAIEGAGEAADWQHGMHDRKQQAMTDVVGYISQRLSESLGVETFSVAPRHLIRGTAPNAFDLDLCKNTGKLMVDAALSGYTGCSVNYWQGDYVLVPLETACREVKQVEVSGYYFISMMEKYFLEAPAKKTNKK